MAVFVQLITPLSIEMPDQSVTACLRWLNEYELGTYTQKAWQDGSDEPGKAVSLAPHRLRAPASLSGMSIIGMHAMAQRDADRWLNLASCV